jgi:hypothetical protein
MVREVMTELLLLYKQEQNTEGDTFCSNSAIQYYCMAQKGP